MPNYYYSSRSRINLSQCDKRLQELFSSIIESIDCTIITGHREQQAQDDLYYQGKSQVMFPHGKHNILPSKAVDAAPYPIDWKDRERATLFAGFVLGSATERGIKLRWGGDWNKDWQVKDNNFDDLWHFELVE